MGDTPDHLGHRARLRARLLDDADGLADYELVEYLLALAIPRRDTKPLAKTLLREFGSLAQLVSADPESLRRVDGLGDTGIAALKIVQATGLRLLKGEAQRQMVVGVYLADAKPGPNGPEPIHFREAFRTRGPSNYAHGKQVDLTNV